MGWHSAGISWLAADALPPFPLSPLPRYAPPLPRQLARVHRGRCAHCLPPATPSLCSFADEGSPESSASACACASLRSLLWLSALYSFLGGVPAWASGARGPWHLGFPAQSAARASERTAASRPPPTRMYGAQRPAACTCWASRCGRCCRWRVGRRPSTRVPVPDGARFHCSQKHETDTVEFDMRKKKRER